MPDVKGPLTVSRPLDGCPEWDINDADGKLLATAYTGPVAEALVVAFNRSRGHSRFHDVEDLYKEEIWKSERERITFLNGYWWEIWNPESCRWREQSCLISKDWQLQEGWWKLTSEQLAAITKHAKSQRMVSCNCSAPTVKMAGIVCGGCGFPFPDGAFCGPPGPPGPRGCVDAPGPCGPPPGTKR